MSTVLIARFKSKKEAEKAALSLKASADVLLGENIEELEDFILGQFIEEGMQEEGEISSDEFKKFLDEKIDSLDK